MVKSPKEKIITWLQLYKNLPPNAQVKPVTLRNKKNAEISIGIWPFFPTIAQKSKNKEGKKLTTKSCALYEPSLSNSPEDMSHSHISNEPETLPVAKSILEGY